ncbi:MAG: SMC-Scp complex subunit ScpB, partial [Candidatus Acidiferrales bacterium]
MEQENEKQIPRLGKCAEPRNDKQVGAAGEKKKTMTEQEMQSALEAIIYAADEPATLDQIVAAVGGERAEVRAGLDRLVASYAVEERGVEVRKVAGGWKMYT